MIRCEHSYKLIYMVEFPIRQYNKLYECKNCGQTKQEVEIL